MSNKSKGSNTERELVSLFTENGWRALRVAGSGVNDNSPCDVIVGKAGKKGYAIEVKSSRSSYIYIKKSQIEDFLLFSEMMGLRPILALRFIYEGWIFLALDKLQDSGKNWVISKDRAQVEGKRFAQIF
ncbi:MAG: Holliday junction resolvase Hjc [Nanoarchaeota archaeon]